MTNYFLTPTFFSKISLPDSKKETMPANAPHSLFIFYKWTRRGLNPRPNKEAICFLHAYLRLDFRAPTRPKPPIGTLSLKTSSCTQGRAKLFPIYLHHRIKTLRKNSSWVMSRSNTCVGIKLIYYTSIKQRERKCFRQLNFRKPRLKCPPSSALHAYIPHRLAVKSSLALQYYGCKDTYLISTHKKLSSQRPIQAAEEKGFAR